MSDDELGLGFIAGIGLIGVVFVIGLMGASIGEGSAVQKGRNQGVVFCSEKPEQCKVEYSYLKLKESQK